MNDQLHMWLREMNRLNDRPQDIFITGDRLYITCDWGIFNQ